LIDEILVGQSTCNVTTFMRFNDRQAIYRALVPVQNTANVSPPAQYFGGVPQLSLQDQQGGPSEWNMWPGEHFTSNERLTDNHQLDEMNWAMTLPYRPGVLLPIIRQLESCMSSLKTLFSVV
jgi:hypothetical protein